MKTMKNNSGSALQGVALSVLLFLFIFNDARAQHSFDHVINRGGEVRISLLGGIPIVGSTEFAYGISDRFTFGVLGGFTPFEEAVGIRMRTVLYREVESFRIYYCTPVILYPQTRRVDPDPWFIIRPNINFEWMKGSNFRYKLGGSIIGSSSYHDLFGDKSRARHPQEIWTAVHAGLSLPLGKALSFQAEISYITKGIQPVNDFFGGPPFILITGLSHTF